MTKNADHGGRVSVPAHDGVRLAVSTTGRSDAPVTVVFVHGHCLNAESWSSLRHRLAATWGEDLRIVAYDHRGHGSSEHGPVQADTIEQLGHDLHAVIETVVPAGPVVLVGHSMGGMATLAYARNHPHSIGSRVVGIALIATAAGGITELGLGRLLPTRTVSWLCAAVRHTPTMVQRSRRLGAVASRIVVRCTCGRGESRVSAVAAALAGNTSTVTMASFVPSLMEFDERESLAGLSHIPSLVLCGTEDMMTPFEHSLAIATRLPSSELVSVNGAGHSVILERDAEVASALTALLSRVTDSVLTSRVD